MLPNRLEQNFPCANGFQDNYDIEEAKYLKIYVTKFDRIFTKKSILSQLF